MPVLVGVLTAYSEVTKADAAVGNSWSPNAVVHSEMPSDCDSAGNPVPTTKPSGDAVVTSLSLLEVGPHVNRVSLHEAVHPGVITRLLDRVWVN